MSALRRAASRCGGQPLGTGDATIAAGQGQPLAEAGGGSGGAKMAFKLPIRGRLSAFFDFDTIGKPMW